MCSITYGNNCLTKNKQNQALTLLFFSRDMIDFLDIYRLRLSINIIQLGDAVVKYIFNAPLDFQLTVSLIAYRKCLYWC
jgi:hypothetical protein